MNVTHPLISLLIINNVNDFIVFYTKILFYKNKNNFMISFKLISIITTSNYRDNNYYR